MVTGPGTGIGRAIAQRLAAEGARLTLLARDESRLRDVVPGAITKACDIRDRDQVFAAIDEPLDALVANAGIGGPNEPGEGDRFDDIVQTNLFGSYWCCRAAEPLLADGGRIVLTSSILARIGVPGYAFDGLTREQAFEVAMREVPLGRMSEPGEIAGTVAWLLSADAMGVTGQAVDHNNGAFMI